MVLANADPVYNEGYLTGRKLLQQAAAQYAPGGGYTAGVEAMLARLSKKSMASGMNNLVSSGLAGTTMAGGLANKFAEETAAPTLAQAESERAKGLADIYMQSANFAGQYGNPRQTSTIIAPSKLTSSAFSPSTSQPSAPVSDRSSQGMLDRNGQPVTTQPATTRSSLNLYNTPGAVGASQEQNWVVINGRQYTQDPTTGQWNIPLGLADKGKTPLTNAKLANTYMPITGARA
jgi:hypothetical protein